MSEAPWITEAGIYELDEAAYHADPVVGGSLSSTVARKLLGPNSCPALAKHAAENPEHKSQWDDGSAVHKLVLGKGAEIVAVDAKDWRTTKAKEARAAARLAGKIPLLAHDLAAAKAMAAAVRANPHAARLLAAGIGQPEQTVVWQDEATGVWCRAMLDWFPADDGWATPVAVDLKTTTSVALPALAKTVANWAYHQQEDFYLRGLASVGINAGFCFVFVEKDPPHLVQVVELDDPTRADAWRRNERALRVWADCRKTGVWPAYSNDIELIGLPRWAITQQNEEFAA